MKLVIIVALATAAFAANIPSYPRESYQQAYTKSYEYAPMPYRFSWGVKDEPSYNNYAHEQESDGKVTTGSYRVLLPDGRTQIVTYRADDYGYVADVKYEGEVKSYDYKPAAYKPVYSNKPSYREPAYPEPAYPEPAVYNQPTAAPINYTPSTYNRRPTYQSQPSNPPPRYPLYSNPPIYRSSSAKPVESTTPVAEVAVAAPVAKVEEPAMNPVTTVDTVAAVAPAPEKMSPESSWSADAVQSAPVEVKPSMAEPEATTETI